MNPELRDISDPAVAAKFATYPDGIRPRLIGLRRLILEVATAHSDVGSIEESLKWGEPSYAAKGGSPVRIGWSQRDPERYAVYFNCNTKLVDTFKEVYGDLFDFGGNRSIRFHIGDEVPEEALKHCVLLALRYHRLKHLTLLGA